MMTRPLSDEQARALAAVVRRPATTGELAKVLRLHPQQTYRLLCQLRVRDLIGAHPSPNGSPELLWVEVTS